MLDREDKNDLECYHIRWAADYLDPQDYLQRLCCAPAARKTMSCIPTPKYDTLCDTADVSQHPAQRAALCTARRRKNRRR